MSILTVHDAAAALAKRTIRSPDDWLRDLERHGRASESTWTPASLAYFVELVTEGQVQNLHLIMIATGNPLVQVVDELLAADA